MDALTSKINLLPGAQYTCFIVPSLFSEQECKGLLTAEIRNSFQKAITNYPTYYRNNDRFVLDNEDLAARLFSKVRPYLPQTIEIDSKIAAENGTWNLLELNTRLRFCKYSANQYFNRHLDGVHYKAEHIQSKLTFMIYLNSATEFEGGNTQFFKTKDATDVWASYTPVQGDLIVFDHNVWHEGAMLLKGEKFVLRSDIIYSRDAEESASMPFSGHLGYIWCLLKFDGDKILSGGRDKEIKCWDSHGGFRQSLSGHQHSILAMAKLDDDTFITGSRDRQILVWKQFKLVKSIQIHAAVVLSLCSLGNGVFASGSGDNTIKIADTNGAVLKTLTEHKNWVWQVIDLGSGFIASCSEDTTIKIWNVDAGVSVSTIYTKVPVISLAFNAATRQLICGDLEGEISMIICAEDFEQLKVTSFKGHSGIIRAIKNIDDKRFATGGEDNKVKIWGSDQNLLAEFEHENFVQSIEILDSNIIISASYDGTIKTWTI